MSWTVGERQFCTQEINNITPMESRYIPEHESSSNTIDIVSWKRIINECVLTARFHTRHGTLIDAQKSNRGGRRERKIEIIII